MTSKTRALNRSDTRQTRAEDDFDQALVERDPLGRFTGRGGPGRKEKPETQILREIRRTAPEGILKAQEKLISLIDDPDKQISLAASKALWSKAPDIPWEEKAENPLGEMLLWLKVLMELRTRFNDPEQVIVTVKAILGDDSDTHVARSGLMPLGDETGRRA